MRALQQPSDLNIAYATHEGMSGKHNEDSLGVFAWQLDGGRVMTLGVVADGVGGQSAGEIASRVAVEEVRSYFSGQTEIGDVNRHLEEAIQAANAAVYQASLENAQYEGMSTTMAIALILEGRLFTAHVGDSRIYLLRDGQLRQLSTDHTWAQEAIEAGLLTRQQAKTHPNRNVIRRHLGIENAVEVDHRLVIEPGGSPAGTEAQQGTALKPGDTLLICSDGLTDMISDEAVHETLDTFPGDLAQASQVMVDKANAAGGKDNITVVLIQVPGGPVAAVGPSAGRAAVAPLPVPDAPRQPAAAARSRGTPWLLIGGGLLLLILIAGGAAFAFLAANGGTPTPTATATEESLPADPSVSATIGAPATAAILASPGAGTAPPAADGTTVSTPGLIPTLRATATAAVAPTRTAAPTSSTSGTAGPAPTATDAPSSGGPTSVPATSAPGVTPSATATSAPATPTNPPSVPTSTATSQPPATSVPPTTTNTPLPFGTPVTGG